MNGRLKRFSDYSKYKADVLLNKRDFENDIRAIRRKWGFSDNGFDPRARRSLGLAAYLVDSITPRQMK